MTYDCDVGPYTIQIKDCDNGFMQVHVYENERRLHNIPPEIVIIHFFDDNFMGGEERIEWFHGEFILYKKGKYAIRYKCVTMYRLVPPDRFREIPFRIDRLPTKHM